MKVEIKKMEHNLNNIAEKTDESRDLISDLKVDNNTTMDGISAAKQTTAALKSWFNSLLDRINMTAGKLNVIEQQAKDIKIDVTQLKA